MLFAGLLILGEFLERRFKEHFEQLERKQKELGIKLPPFPKPIFIGSTKNVHSMKTKPGSKTGDNTLLIKFEQARISNYTFDSIECLIEFKIYISVSHFMLLSNITDVIMGIHNAPIHIEEHQNVFTEKGYIKPQVHVLNSEIVSVTSNNSIEKTSSDVYQYTMSTRFTIVITWPPTLKV